VNDERLLQMKDMRSFIREHRGIDVALSTLQKRSALNIGPKADAVWGRRRYSRPSSVLDWVDNVLLRPAPKP
jgi:hypothetical protein